MPVSVIISLMVGGFFDFRRYRSTFVTWPSRSFAMVRSKDELEFRYRVLTKIAHDIVTAESIRMNVKTPSSDGRGGSGSGHFGFVRGG